MVSKDLFTGLTVFSLVLAVTTVLFVLINFGNIVHLVRHNAMPTVAAGCSNDPDNTCKYGLRHQAIQGSHLVNYCETKQRLVGEACTSECFDTEVDGDLVCDSNATCVSTASEKCLGYCNLTAEDDDNYVELLHPDCVGKLTFHPFFSWDSVGSSEIVVNQLFYSDYGADCILDRCVWFAARVDVVADVNTLTGDYYTYIHGSIKDPLFYLNSTNKACISYTLHQLDTNFTTQLFRKSYSAELNSQAIARGTLIQYFYSCAAMNEDILTAENLITAGVKRSVMDNKNAHSKFESLIGGANIPKIRELMKNPVRSH